MRRTWDAAARTENQLFVGTQEPVATQLKRVLTLVDAQLGGSGTCLEVGCGDGRMTGELAKRWGTVFAIDVSPEMLRRATCDAPPNVHFQLVSGLMLDGVPDACADQLVCYGVLQHLPGKRLIRSYLDEFARALVPSGEAVVHLPLLRTGPGYRLWRNGRRLAIAVRSSRSSDFSTGIAYMGARLTERELDSMVRASGLVIAAHAELESYFARSHNVVLRLTKAVRRAF
jgi:SAM-dependent methyltransferase